MAGRRFFMDEGKRNMAAEKRYQARNEAYDWIQSIVSALLICVLIFVFIARIISVEGPSMNPTLNDGDKLLVSGLFYTPKQGDIVILRKESFKEEPIVKRVIAVTGQTIDIDFEKGIVYVDGKALEEDYTAEPTWRTLDFEGPVTVPEGCIFVMGDNRNNSTDSRSDRIGFVDLRYVLGRAYLLLLPGADPSTEKKDMSRIGLLH
jgi:signal peptidase I